MKSRQRIFLSYSVLLIYIFTKPFLQTFLIAFSYYFIGAIVFVIWAVIHHSNYARSIRMKRDVIRCVDDFLFKNPKQFDKFASWLKKEGFKMRVSAIGNFHMKNKYAEVSYYPRMHEPLVISKFGKTDDYLIYREDEELKVEIGNYFKYIVEKYEKTGRKRVDSIWFMDTEFAFDEFYSALFTRTQFYLFLVLVLLNLNIELGQAVLIYFTLMVLENIAK